MGGDENRLLELHAKTPLLSSPVSMCANLIRYKELVKHFIFRDLKVKYHNSIIGYGWSAYCLQFYQMTPTLIVH